MLLILKKELIFQKCCIGCMSCFSHSDYVYFNYIGHKTDLYRQHCIFNQFPAIDPMTPSKFRTNTLLVMSIIWVENMIYPWTTPTFTLLHSCRCVMCWTVKHYRRNKFWLQETTEIIFWIIVILKFFVWLIQYFITE